MCGIIGYLDKRGGHGHHIGRTMLGMLQALSCRGPDSTGIAVFGPPRAGWTLRLKRPAGLTGKPALDAARHALDDLAMIAAHDEQGEYLRLEIEATADAEALERQLMERLPGAEIVSLGHSLEVVKQVGSPAALEATFQVREMRGSHGIGHTRLSTESKVDLSHSQPFWAHGVTDLVTVHNGHVTNYHKLRRTYEQKGYRFYTENDSEVIGVYLRDRMAAGLTLADALRSSLDDLDGSFCYLAATPGLLAFVKDRFAFKPLVVAETERFVAIATEEMALRKALGDSFTAKEPAPGSIGLWTTGVPVVHG